MQAAGTQVIANSGHDDMIVCLPDATTTTTSSSSTSSSTTGSTTYAR
jgi:hypothetical protein